MRDAGGFDASEPPIGLDAGSRDARPPDPVDGGPIDGGLCGASVPPTACTMACGNGVREGCDPFSSDGCCSEDGLEICDGADLGGATCESAGYVSGSLRCGADCLLDPRSCSFCLPDPRILGCGRVEGVGRGVESLALSVGGTGIFLAWVDRRPEDFEGGQVRVMRFDLDLTPVAGPTCLDITDARAVALSPLGPGALLAVERSAGIDLLALDGDAEVLARGAHLPGGTAPVFESDPSGTEATLLWGSWSSPRQAVFLSRFDAAARESLRTQVFDSFTELHYGSVTTDDRGAYLVAVRTDRGVEVARVERDGTPHLGFVTVAHGSTEYPQIAWMGDSAVMTYSDFSERGKLMWVRVGADGAPLVAPIELGRIPRLFNVSPVAVWPERRRAVILFGTYTGWTGHGEELLLRQVSRDGDTLTEDFPIELAPGYVRDYRIAQNPLGSPGEAFVAWISVGPPNEIGLARVAL